MAIKHLFENWRNIGYQAQDWYAPSASLRLIPKKPDRRSKQGAGTFSDGDWIRHDSATGRGRFLVRGERENPVDGARHGARYRHIPLWEIGQMVEVRGITELSTARRLAKEDGIMPGDHVTVHHPDGR